MDGDGQNPPYEIRKLINNWKKIPNKLKNLQLFVVTEKIGLTL